MHIRKRIFSLFLAFVCAFFTGCNSIIYNGNINFEAFEPETIPAITNALKDQSMDQQKLEDMKKYEISGLNAFYILPSHENRPDQVIDFKVLDYTSDRRFIYAYLTPYYGDSKDLSGLNGNETTGKAPEEDAWQTPTPTDTKYNVTVLMAYDPETREYQVFFSALSERAEEKTVTNKASSGEVLTAEINSGILYTNRLVKREEYFIFHNMIAYVYDSSGEEIQVNSLAESVSQEIARLKQKVSWRNRCYVDQVEESIMDVTMDGYYCIYIPVTLEVSPQEAQDEESLEAATYSAVITCYCLDIGGESSNVVFVSFNENWEKQKEIWLGVAKDAEGNPIVFESEDDMMAYAQHYSMDNLKWGSFGASEDRFGVFRTQQDEDGTGLHLELAAVENLWNPGLAPVYANGTIGDIEYFDYKDYQGHFTTRVLDKFLEILLGGTDIDYWSRYFLFGYTLNQGYHYELMSAFREVFTQMAQGDPEVIRDVAGREDIRYYLIPWYAPGRWQVENGQNDLPHVQVLFAYQTRVYQTETGQETVGRYNTIEFPGKEYDSPVLNMTVAKWTEPLERTFCYYEEEWVEAEVLNEDGAVTQTREKKKVKKFYTETAKQYPLEYQLIFPEGTRSFGAEVLETDEMVDASGDLGAIYYMENENSGDTEDSTSRIRYHDGKDNVLLDTQVPGKAIDAGILHYDAGGTSTEIALYVTDSGIKFYERGPEGFFGSGKFVTQEEMSSPTSIYGVLKLGDTEQTDAEMEGELEISDTEDAIIQNKMKSGTATEVFEIANFSMLNRNSILISSLTSGMLMTNYRNGLNVQLESGAYYASFPCKDEDRSPTNKEFMVVGYRTEDYVYQPSDLVRAKCYRMNLGAQTSKLEKEAFEQYVDGMVSSYLNRRYRMEKGEDGQWKIMQQTDVEKAQNVKIEQLLFEADDSTKVKNWLVQLAGELGISSVSNETVEAAVQLRNKFLTQKEALKEFYMLAGLGSVTELPTNAEDLEKEGLLISAGYVDVLKQMLVDMKLSEKAIEGMQPGEQKAQYAQYRQQKLQSALLNERGSGIQIDAESGTVTGTVSVGETEDGSVTRSDKTELEQSLTALSQMEFYDTVLQDVQKEYERRIQANPNPLGDLTWDEYLVDLLKRISPDNSINQKEQGLQELCALAGLAEPMVDMEQLAKEVSELYRTEELEELIIGYKVDGSAYQSRGYRVSFAAFQEKVFATKEEKKAELHASDFYQVIKDIIAADETLSTDPDEWEKCLTQILGKCGAGIVLETGTVEE